MLSHPGYLLLLCPLAAFEPAQDETRSQDEKKGRKVIAEVVVEKEGTRSAFGADDEGKEPASHAAESWKAKRERRQAKLRGLAQRIAGAEEVLLYDDAAERRAIEYNALQRERTREQHRRLEGLQAEQLEFLKGLSSSYRSKQENEGRTPARAWLERNKLPILRGIRRYGDYGRQVKSAERSLAELDLSDERLRRVMAWKRSEKQAARQRDDTVVTDTPVLEVPEVPDTEPEATMSQEELELFEKLFPTDR